MNLLCTLGKNMIINSRVIYVNRYSKPSNKFIGKLWARIFLFMADQTI